jgi:hypothetical protein
MKKICFLLAIASSLFLISCASTHSYPTVAHFTELAPGSMPANRYIVLGEVSAENTLIVATEDITKEMENEISPEPKILSIKTMGDDRKYGFIGKPTKMKLNIYERAEALAEYKLIELAKYNKADAIICFNSSTEVQRDGSNTMLTTKVSGLAVRIVPDEGYAIEYPVADVWDKAAYEYTDEELEAEAAAEAEAEASAADEVEDVE